MKKNIVLFSICICLLFLISCSPSKSYVFLNQLDEVSEITIVKLTFEDKKMIQTTLQKIEDEALFLEELKKIRCYTRIGDPTGATEEGVDNVVFRISYLNGEYELIDWAGQSIYTLKNGFRFYSGFSGFDKEEFESLMTKHMTIQLY